MPNEFAGQHGDQVPVLVDKIAGPRPQPVGDPNRSTPTVWRLAKCPISHRPAPRMPDREALIMSGPETLDSGLILEQDRT